MFKNKKYFFMSAKRPRPAIPVLVHVDNPSSGGGSGDLTTVNENTTTLKNMVGTNNSTISDTSLIGAARNLVASVGNYGSAPSTAGSTVRSFLFNLREGIGSSTSTPTATGTTVRDLLTAIKENTASGGGGGGSAADLTTVNEKTTAISAAIGDGADVANDQSLIGLAKGITASLGSMKTSDAKSSSNIKGRLYNIQSSIGDALDSPVVTGTSVRDLLLALKTVVGTLSSSSKDTDLIGCVRNLRVAVGASGNQLLPGGDSIRSFLFNLRTAVGDSTASPVATGTTVRDLLTAIKQNTASGGSGGGGGSADLTTVNEKTTALAAAIGSASDDSSTVSVIGLLKSITDKY